MEEKAERRLRQKRQLLRRRAAGIEEFVRGSVVLMKRPCTYDGCRKCAAGERHPTWVLTVSVQGKTRTVYLGAGRVDAARRMTENYRRLMALVEQAAEVNRVLLTGRDSVRKGRADGQGEARGQGP
jgi:hypothetical protein